MGDCPLPKWPLVFWATISDIELAKVEAEDLEATCLREGCVLLRPQLGVPPVTLSGPADALD
jgi:hypothetical protein